MLAPLMPKATAVWLVENTSLTFDQIADFCGLHPLEVQAIADGEVAVQMQGLDPVANGQTTTEEIERCQADPEARLKLSDQAVPQQFVKHKGPRYTPISKRQDKPDAIMYLLRSHPELSDTQISKLIGTTKPTISAVRDRTHWNSANIKPRHPVGLGLCTLEELDTVVNNTGTIRANTLGSRNGEIILDGGAAGVTANRGTLQAAGTESGGTEVRADDFADRLVAANVDIDRDFPRFVRLSSLVPMAGEVL